MAITFVNYHVRTDDTQSVARIVQETVRARAYVSPPAGSWITICDETSEMMEPAEIDRLATEFSRRLQTTLFTFLIPDQQIFAYHIFDNGDLLDEYNSTPELYGPISDEARERLAGHPSVVLQYCRAGTQLEDIRSILRRSQPGGVDFAASASAHDRAHRLANLLGIERIRATFGFYDVAEKRVPDAEAFMMIESSRYARPLRRPISPRSSPREKK